MHSLHSNVNLYSIENRLLQIVASFCKINVSPITTSSLMLLVELFVLKILTKLHFFQVLNCSSCVDPGTYGRRSDPWGHYVKRYVPEIAKMPVEYVYEPWKAPLEVQASTYVVNIKNHNHFGNYYILGQFIKLSKTARVSFCF